MKRWYALVRRWIKDRCGECGQRFLWRDSRSCFDPGGPVYHERCMTLLHARSQLDDITGYLRGTADPNARWRVERRLKWLDDQEKVSA